MAHVREDAWHLPFSPELPPRSTPALRVRVLETDN